MSSRHGMGTLEMGEKKTTHKVQVSGLDDAGYGEAVDNGLCLKIPGAAPGDEVVVSMVHESPHTRTAWCRIEGVVERGAQFRKPECPHAWPVNGRCGGCPLLHLEKEAALQFKLSRVERALGAHQVVARVHRHSSPKQSGYRNRGQFVASRGEDGAVLLGAYAPRSHDVVSMAGCRVLRPPLARVSSAIARMMTQYNVPVFPDRGGVRYVTLRAAVNGATLVDIVLGGEPAFKMAELAAKLLSLRHIVGVSMSVNAHAGNAIRVGPSTLLTGTDRVVEPVGAVRIALSAASFSQLNRDVMTAMYARAAALPAVTPGVVWDLYAGVGGLGLTFAKSHPGCRLLGTDSVDVAVTLAKENADANGVAARYETTDLSSGLPVGWPLPDVVLLNPPRRGLDAIVVERMMEIMPSEMIYMSCNPTSFARDARAFLAAGYEIGEVHAYDMLPGTAHVEIIAVFARTRIG